MARNHLIILLISTLLLCNIQRAEAAAAYITSSGNGVFIVTGSGMDGAAGIELTVNYDTSQLSSPTVSQGGLISGALMAVNTSKPGSIKIAAVSTRAFPTSGQIATISFATHSGSGRVSIVASMINSKGASLSGGGDSVAFDSQTTTTPPSGFVSADGTPSTQQVITTTPSTPVAAVATSSGPVYLGTISMPSDLQTKAIEKPADTGNQPITQVEPPFAIPVKPVTEEKPSSGAQSPEKIRMTVYKGIIDNFQAFNGDKSPANLIALFDKQISQTIRQEPFIALSDGKTPLKILVELKNTGNKSPNFALNSAKLVSLKIDPAGSVWIVEAMPQSGVLQATLTILTDTDIIEYPLTLAPPADGVSTTETDFLSFLKESGAKAPKRDLNGDGKYDYQDDFIYTANFLSKKRSAATPAK